MFYSLKLYITVMYPETEGFGLKSPISKKQHINKIHTFRTPWNWAHLH